MRKAERIRRWRALGLTAEIAATRREPRRSLFDIAESLDNGSPYHSLWSDLRSACEHLTDRCTPVSHGTAALLCYFIAEALTTEERRHD